MKRNRVTFPLTCEMMVTGSAPTLRGGSVITPSAGSLTLTGSAPTVTVGILTRLTPGAASLTLTGSAPTVTVAAATAVAPGGATLTLTGSAPTITQAAAGLSIIGTPGAANSTTVTLPTHAVGDIIVIFAFNASGTTAVTKPGASGTVPAWVDIDAPAGNNGCYARTAQFVATATNHTSGTWTSATNMAVIVVRGQASSPIGGHALSGGNGNGSATAPSITMTKTDGTSMILEFYGGINSGSFFAWGSAPAGYTRRAAANTTTSGACLNTKNVTTSDGSIAQSDTTGVGTGYQGATIEILTP